MRTPTRTEKLTDKVNQIRFLLPQRGSSRFRQPKAGIDAAPFPSEMAIEIHRPRLADARCSFSAWKSGGG
jgi:hypothetical protein